MISSVTKKWLFLKVASAILIPLMMWFAFNLASFYDKSYVEVATFISAQPNKLLFSLFLFFKILSTSKLILLIMFLGILIIAILGPKGLSTFINIIFL